MDSRLRELYNHAKSSERGSQEDLAYISALYRAGELSLSFIEAARVAGDIGAFYWLQMHGFLSAEAEYQVPDGWIYSGTDRFIEIFDEKIVRDWALPLGILIQWVSDCIRKLIALYAATRTGRGGPMFKAPTPTQTRALHEILTGIEHWQATPNAPLQPLIDIGMQYCAENANIALGIRDRMDGALSDAVCCLLQAVICSEYPCGEPGDAQVPYVFSDDIDHPIELDDAENFIVSAINSIEGGKRLCFSRGRNQTIARQMTIADRVPMMQSLADLLLKRDWHRLARPNPRGPRKYSDYVYATADDSIRVRIFQRGSGRWDFDMFHRERSLISTFSADAGDDFRTKKEALAEARRMFPGLEIITPGETWTG